MKKTKYIGILIIVFIVLSACHSKDKEDHSGHDMNPETNEQTDVNEISLSKQQIKLGNITTQTIAETQSSLNQTYTGVLTINQEKVATISAKAMGRIEKLFLKTTGEYVTKNTPVYSLYSEDIAIAKQDYSAAYKQLAMPGDFGKNAQNLLKAAKQKLQYYGVTNSQIENNKGTIDVSPYTTFYSNTNGYVSEIIATEGSYVMEGSPLIKLADLNTLWLEIQVNVNYAKNLSVGQSATVSFADFPEKTIKAKISFINPEIIPNTRLLLIRLQIPNQNLQLKPGMQAIAKINQAAVKGLFIPTDAVIREQNASYIWVEKRPGVFENLMVETGIETNGMIEIKSEIDASKKIVITGTYAINSEYKFRKGSDPMEGMKM
ncbi:efflux RND transporter periplasmic adaptor subunit [Flavobacterium sp.]|jgi:Cu(I)/Ag(I) efflux system membrane fusion protein|uniref:efflux RND transporter periplasmic adaptor subunit n=1 Tax=Flavobacterium sp. TaxID=239 RepID=UPI002FD9B188